MVGGLTTTEKATLSKEYYVCSIMVYQLYLIVLQFSSHVLYYDVCRLYIHDYIFT